MSTTFLSWVSAEKGRELVSAQGSSTKLALALPLRSLPSRNFRGERIFQGCYVSVHGKEKAAQSDGIYSELRGGHMGYEKSE